MTVREERPSRLWAISVVVEPASRMIVSPSPIRLAALTPDLSLFFDVLHMLKRQGLDLFRHRAQERAAVLPVDVSVGLEFFEVLPDGRLGDAEGGAEIANPRASFLLQPIEDLHPPRLGEQPVEVGIGQGARSWSVRSGSAVQSSTCP